MEKKLPKIRRTITKCKKNVFVLSMKKYEGVSVEGDGHGDAPVHGGHKVVEAGLQDAHPVYTNHVPEARMA